MLRAFQWDLARQVERPAWLLAQLPRYAAWGYDELYLHLEDAVEYPSLPGVARADAYRYRFLEKLTAAATRAGIRVVPIANLLGHTQYLIKTPALRDLNELRAADGSPLERGQICPLHPRTPEVAAKLLHDLAPFCTAGKVHVGLDESFHLARCPRCRAEVAQIGLAAHFAGHVGRLHALAAGLGLRTGIWADMLAFIPEAIPLLPRDLIAYDWYYYPFARHPRVELFNFAECDLAPALRAQGIEYWGCPLNGAFRHEPLPVFGERLGNARSWWQRSQRTGAAGFLMTSWEPSRLAAEMAVVVDAAAASLWLNPEADDATTMLAHGFARAAGLGAASARSAARAALQCDEHAFAGYARWEINDRWDASATPDGGAARFVRSAQFFGRLAGSPLPPAFAASAAWLRYLATRDAFVRTAAQGVWKLRRALAKGQAKLTGPGPGGADQVAPTTPPPNAIVTYYVTNLQATAAAFSTELRRGRAAARTMWRRTRDPKVRGPNELMLAADALRLRVWRAWLARCRRQPFHAWESSPVTGRWQLSFAVHNFAPALQKVVVEQQQPGGTWLMLHGRFTIEFRAAAARSHARFQQPFSTPIDDPAAPLRIAVRGLGQVAIGNIVLTDGVTSRRQKHPRRKIILGRQAPRRGWPELDWKRNADQHVVAFAKL